MVENEMAILAVVVERILVVSFAGLSMILGWNLFRKSIVLDQTGRIELGHWKMELQKVGPGTFFAAFGAIVLALAFAKPMTIEMNSGGASGKVVVKGVVGVTDKENRRYVGAVNTLDQIDGVLADRKSDNGTVTLMQANADDLHSATKILIELRRVVLVDKFGARAVDEWERSGRAYLENPKLLSPGVRATLEPLGPWMSATAAGDRGK